MRFAFPALFAFSLLLAACSSVPAVKTVSFEPPDTPGGRMCIGQCQAAKDACRDSCNLDYRQCTGKVQSQAILDFDKYTREQYLSHEAAELRPRDFERMTPCDDANKKCDAACDEDYQGCYKTCGGTVNVLTSCQSFCF